MNVTFDKQFLEKIAEGVILLNRAGKITHFSAPHAPRLNCGHDKTGALLF